jgi:predicted metalloprotease
MKKLYVFFVVCCVCFSVSAFGSKIKDVNLSSMVEQSDVIVKCRVLEKQSQWVGDYRGKHIYTTVILDSNVPIKGELANKKLVLEVVGGTVGDITEVVSDSPMFQVNEEAMLFLKGNPLRIVEGIDGKRKLYNNKIYIGGKPVDADKFLHAVKYLVENPSAASVEEQLIGDSLVPSDLGGGQLPPNEIPIDEKDFNQTSSMAPEKAPSGQNAENIYAAPSLETGENQQFAASTWQTILSEGFEGAFPGSNWNLLGTPTWNDRNYSAHTGSWSGYCVGSSVTPPGPYPNNTSSWMIYGPFSLVGATDAKVDFWYRNKSESNYDLFKWMASTNGTNFYGYQISGDENTWRSQSFDLKSVPTLGNLCGQSQVWIAFYFSSDSTNTDIGAFVDDILIQKYAPPPSPTLISSSCTVSPASITRGGRLTVNYGIHNPNTSSMTVGLGCSIKLNGTSNWIDDPGDDVYKNCPAGDSTQTRYFDIPYDAAFGSYDVAWGLWETIGSGSPWDMLQKDNQFNVIPTATIYDAWWSNGVDQDGDGYVRSARLNWDSDVVGCSGSLTVYEKIYWRVTGNSTWNLLTTTSPHTITNCLSSDSQYRDIDGGSHNEYDWKIEVYRSGQSSPDYSRDPSNDSDLSAYEMETAAEDVILTPVITSMSPSKASAGTNTQVTISGSSFGSVQGSSTVDFFYRSGSPKILASIISWSDTQIICTVPVGEVDGYPASAASGPVTVTTPSGNSNEYTFKVTFGTQNRWLGSVVSYRINANTSDCTGESAAIQTAAQTWNSAGANFSFNYAGTHSNTTSSYDGVNEIMWGNTGSSSTIAMATTWYSGGYITECDIVFNDPDFTWSSDGSPSSSEMDVQTIALHELGHWLHLRDLYGNIGDGEYDTAKAMYGFGSNGALKIALHADDIAGIKWIYGTAVSPAISVTPASRDFGSVQVGSYADLTFTVQNTGGGTLTGSSSVPTPFSIVSGGSYSLTTNQSQVVTVRFSPSAAQSYNQNVTFTGGGGATRPVTGTGYLAPVISVTPASRDFGSVQVGSYTDLTFTVQNTGGGTLTGSASVPAPFSIVSGGSYSLTTNQSQIVTVRFSPTSAQSYNQNVTFTGGGGATRPVSGSGYIPCTISVTPASRDFGSVQVGSYADLTFTVQNTGGGTISGSVSTSVPFSIVSGGAYNLSAGQSQTVTVRFSPTAGQSYNGTVTFTGCGDVTRPVTGIGYLAPAISVTPASRDFGSVQVSSYVDLTFTVQNTGGDTLTGNASVPAPFSIISGGSYSLTTNQSQVVTVRFSPTAAQYYNQNVTFTGGGGATRPVSGTGLLQKFTTMVTFGPNGSVAPSGAIDVNAGDNLVFTATANTGFMVDRWYVDSNLVQIGGNTYTLSNIQSNHTVQVTFIFSGNPSDFTLDGIVNFNDYAVFAFYWTDSLCTAPGWCEGCDYDHSGTVGIEDIGRFAEDWLWAEEKQDINLVGYWKFQEGSGQFAEDSSIYSNKGTLRNGPVWTEDALYFDGIDDWVEVNDSNSLKITNKITISAWIYMEQYSTDFPKVVIKPYEQFDDPFELYTIDLSQYGTYPRFIITDGIPGGDYGYAMDTGYTLSLNNWYQLVGTYDGSIVKLYVNGVLINSNPATLLIGDNNLPVCIGSRLGSNSFKGLADDVRIYNRALTQDEVLAIYNEESPAHP